MTAVAFAAGLASAGILLAILVWSIAVPSRRLWPPEESSVPGRVAAWVPAVILFASAFVLGVADWNGFRWPAALRWPVGLAAIVLGNLAVWWGVTELGWRKTSGAEGKLCTGGLYAWSRNPQYVADVVILAGWLVLSASRAAMPVCLAGIGLLLLAPFAEEPWLKVRHGQAFEDYRGRVRRYL